jgi:hypothetical protein
MNLSAVHIDMSNSTTSLWKYIHSIRTDILQVLGLLLLTLWLSMDMLNVVNKQD